MSADVDYRTQYPNLDALIGGYFHQDFDFNYGSADGAIDAFGADCTADQRVAFLQELSVLLAYSDGSLERALTVMGNAFAFETLGLNARQWMQHMASRIASGSSEPKTQGR